MVLQPASRRDLIAHHRAGGACCPVSQFIEGDRRDLDMDIDPIEQWTGNSAHVAFDLGGVAIATAARIGSIAAWAWVQRGDEHEVGWEGRAAHGARDSHHSVFERLTHHLERFAVELG